MKAVCPICPHHCSLEEGQVGLCRARANVRGTVICTNYGRVTSLALDPIEKKPLVQFYPGSNILSVGSYGCNLRCPFCQNSDISMADATMHTVLMSPQALVERAKVLTSRGNIGIAFTYNEPLVGYEFVRDCAQLAHEAELKTVLVTNGMICREPLLNLLPLIDAMNIDLKGFSQKFYDLVGGDLATVKQAIALCVQRCHVEVTTLIVPGENESEGEMEAEAAWLAEVDSDMALHISRFFPRYRMQDRRPTPVDTIYRLRDAAKKHLDNVYTGNC